MKAIVTYYSHKGKTAAYAREIAMYLWSRGVSVSLCSISDCTPEKLAGCDLLLLGCWTCGWFFFNQRPHPKWVEFARSLPRPTGARLLLFTTYKIRTGSLYRRMSQALGVDASAAVPRLGSRTGRLSVADKAVLDDFITRVSSK